RHPMMTPTHRVPVVLDPIQDSVEHRLVPAMRRDDRQLPAPRGARLRHAIQLLLLPMNRELVQLDVAGLADKGVRAGGERESATAGFETEGEGAEVACFVEDFPFGAGGCDLEGFGPMFADAEIFARGAQVAGGDPEVQG